MYRRPKFLETLIEIRREMTLEADYDVDLFVEQIRTCKARGEGKLISDLADATNNIESGTVLKLVKQNRKAGNG